MVSLSKPAAGDTDWASELTTNWTTLDGAILEKSALTTKGDLFVATASSTLSRLAAGTNGQLLKANSGTSTGLEWSGTGVARAAVESSTQSVGNSTSETTVFTKTIPANLVGSNGMLRLRLLLRIGKTGGGGSTITFRFKFGGTTFFAHAFSPGSGSDTSHVIYEVLIANTATNAQRYFSRASYTQYAADGTGLISASGTIGGANSGSIDTTANQDLVVTTQWTSSPGRDPSVEALYSTCEVVQD